MSRDLRGMMSLLVRVELAGAAAAAEVMTRGVDLALRQTENLAGAYDAWMRGRRGGGLTGVDSTEPRAVERSLDTLRAIAAWPTIAFLRFAAEFEAANPSPAPPNVSAPTGAED